MWEKGLFNGLFDLNRDGKLDSLERALEFGFFVELMESDKKDNEENDDDF